MARSIYTGFPCLANTCGEYNLSEHKLLNPESCGCTMRGLIAEYGSQEELEKHLIVNDTQHTVCVNPRRKTFPLQRTEGESLNRFSKIKRIYVDISALNKAPDDLTNISDLVWHTSIRFDSININWYQPYVIASDKLEYIYRTNSWFNLESDDQLTTTILCTIEDHKTYKTLVNYCPILTEIEIDYDIVK